MDAVLWLPFTINETVQWLTPLPTSIQIQAGPHALPVAETDSLARWRYLVIIYTSAEAALMLDNQFGLAVRR